MARRVLLFVGTLFAGVAVKIALFDVAQGTNPDLGALCVIFLPAAAVLITLGLRAPTTYLERTIRDPSLPPSRVPRWRRPPDGIPVGGWILIPILTLLLGGMGLLILGACARWCGPWPVTGVIFALFALYYWRRKIPERRGGMAKLPVGALVLVPFLVAASVLCVGAMITLVVGAILT